jgi:predicted  nucleic acid-binding Zn-ribbon protein
VNSHVPEAFDVRLDWPADDLRDEHPEPAPTAGGAGGQHRAVRPVVAGAGGAIGILSAQVAQLAPALEDLRAKVRDRFDSLEAAQRHLGGRVDALSEQSRAFETPLTEVRKIVDAGEQTLGQMAERLAVLSQSVGADQADAFLERVRPEFAKVATAQESLDSSLRSDLERLASEFAARVEHLAQQTVEVDVASVGAEIAQMASAVSALESTIAAASVSGDTTAVLVNLESTIRDLVPSATQSSAAETALGQLITSVGNLTREVQQVREALVDELTEVHAEVARLKRRIAVRAGVTSVRIDPSDLDHLVTEVVARFSSAFEVIDDDADVSETGRPSSASAEPTGATSGRSKGAPRRSL